MTVETGLQVSRIRLSWRIVIAGISIALVAVQFASRLTQLGSPETTAFLSESTYYLILAGAALVVLVRAAVNPRDRAAWAFIGVGLAFWAAGDFYYKLSPGEGADLPYPSLADGFYLLLYVNMIIGVRLLGGRMRGQRVISPALVVAMLGTATVWSWAVFGDVIEGINGDTWAVATTLAYPLLDLVLLVSVLFAVAARGWRFDAVFALLASGLVITALADSIYAFQVAHGVYEKETVLEAFWPAGIALIMGAAIARPSPRPEPVESDSLLMSLALTAAAIAVCALISDHFSRLDPATVALASTTLAAAAVQVVLLARERSRSNRRARSEEAIRRASIEGALDCVVSVDFGGTVVEWNRAAERTFGHRREEAVGRQLSELILPTVESGNRIGPLVALCDGRSSRILDRRVEVLACHAKGGILPVELTVIEVGSDPPVYTAFMRDLSLTRRRDEENQRLASILRLSDDAVLTLNPSGIVTSWNHGAEKIYGYPPEDALGHEIGSLIVPEDKLDELGELMDRVMQGEDVTTRTTRRTRDGEILHISLQAFPVRGLSGGVTGITTICHDVTEQELRKQREQLDQDAELWAQRVRDGMSDGSLLLWGQPIVRSGGHVIDHLELLLRMRDGGRTIAPGAFLPHIEKTSLMQELDRWVIARGLEHATRRPVAINLSARSVAKSDLATFIEGALESPEHARNVVFEITETAAVENLHAARDLVTRLSELGCRVALDDFGTGYGSFIYLKHLPVSEIKIDMQFIRNIVEDETDQRIVRSIIAVAQNFKMKTVAEGVEDERTLDLLESYGVDFLQGYHLGRPAAIEVTRPSLAKPEPDRTRSPVA